MHSAKNHLKLLQPIHGPWQWHQVNNKCKYCYFDSICPWPEVYCWLCTQEPSCYPSDPWHQHWHHTPAPLPHRGSTLLLLFTLTFVCVFVFTETRSADLFKKSLWNKRLQLRKAEFTSCHVTLSSKILRCFWNVMDNLRICSTNIKSIISKLFLAALNL